MSVRERETESIRQMKRVVAENKIHVMYQNQL